MPADSFTIADGMLRIRIREIGGRFDGKLTAEGTVAVGRWKQNGPPLPETLRHVTEVPPPSSNPWKWPKTPNRPQTPAKPYPYTEEEVAYASTAAGVKLAATFTYPSSGGPFPAALLIGGSGPLDRNEKAFGHQLFLVLADSLTRHGIAVLRADKRGVGGSSGDAARATTLDYADDAAAGVAYLRSRPEIDPGRIGLVGHSEGANVAPLAAARAPEVAFLVLLAPTGVPGRQIALRQDDDISRGDGAPEGVIAKQHVMREQVLAVIMGEQDNALAETRIRELIRARFAAMAEEERRAEDVCAESVEDALEAARQYLDPWSRFFLSYDPAPALREVKVPTLVLWGSKDVQAPPAVNRGPVEEALKASGCRYRVEVLPGLNHPFQAASTGSPMEHYRIEETMSPIVLSAVADWTRRRRRRGLSLRLVPPMTSPQAAAGVRGA